MMARVTHVLPAQRVAFYTFNHWLNGASSERLFGFAVSAVDSSSVAQWYALPAQLRFARPRALCDFWEVSVEHREILKPSPYLVLAYWVDTRKTIMMAQGGTWTEIEVSELTPAFIAAHVIVREIGSAF